MRAAAKRAAERLTSAAGKEASAGVRHAVPKVPHTTGSSLKSAVASSVKPAVIGTVTVGGLYETRQLINEAAALPPALSGAAGELANELASDLSQLMQGAEDVITAPFRSPISSAITVVSVGLGAYLVYYYFYN